MVRIIIRSELLKVFGRNIRRYRKKKELTQGELSRCLGITGVYLGYLERGQRNPSLLTLAKIAATLGIPPHVLLREPENEFEAALDELNDLLISLNDVKTVTFLKEVMDSYLKLKETRDS